MSSKNLNVNSLDFSGIKTNLKNHLSASATFKDYDFEGSGLSGLLDLLSYVTYYQGIYNNFTVNELFLDTAEKRSSVVSHAKTLGYTPRSYSAPTSIVNVKLGSTAGYSTVLAPGQLFNTVIDGQTYRFTNLEHHTVSLTADGITNAHISDLSIREGTIRSLSSVISDNRDYQKVQIRDPLVDTTTIKVSVQESATDNSGITVAWNRSTDSVGITSTSKAFWVEEDYTGFYSVNFGDGVIGSTLAPGNIVTVSYLRTNGPLTNGVGGQDEKTGRKSFRFSTGNTVDVVSPASGGAFPQSITSIKKSAPRSYSAQDRAVTASDIKALIESNFSGFSSIFVYGGEEANPPEFGRVIVSIKPNPNSIVVDSIKDEILSFIRNRCPVSVQPKIVDPDLTYVRTDTKVVFDPQATALNSIALQDLVEKNVSLFVTSNTESYETRLSRGLLEKYILDNVSGVVSASTDIIMEKRFAPVKTLTTNYEVKFENPIFHPHDGHASVIDSNEFLYFDGTVDKRVFLKDDGSGKLQLFEKIDNVDVMVLDDFGTVNYNSGEVSLGLARLSSLFDESEIKIYAKLGTQLLSSTRSNIIINDTLDQTRDVVSVSQVGDQFTTTLSTPTAASTTTTTTSTSTSAGGGVAGGGGGGGGGGGYGGY